MAGRHLTPKVAAELASNVYLIKDEFSRRGFALKYQDMLNMPESKMAKAETGALQVVKKKHVMVLLAKGKGNYEGQAFVAVKGTASLYDTLTDLNTGVKNFHTHGPVHQGFYYTFYSFSQELKAFVQALEGIHTIHCIGHSLGGAVATLAADWLATQSVGATIKLYTFGSPRVGLDMFATMCTNALKHQNIYRVYHRTDPVPLVPTWPFVHTPSLGVDYLINSPLSGKPWEYHRMKHYIDSARKGGTWSAMASNRPQSYMESSIERWLKSDGLLSLTANTLELMNAAFLWVLKKILNIAGIALVASAGATFTLLDRIAILLHKAIDVSKELGGWVFYLVKKMAALIGVKVKEGSSLTVAFIRRVFNAVHERIANMIWKIGHEPELA